jgi:beta-N-acetylhexosaminidase
LPVIDADRARLDGVELPPFRAAIEEKVGAIMTAHIALPRIEPDRVPATLSRKLLTEILREEMGFSGVLFTDAMNMRGIAAHYDPGDAAVRAVKAGADVVLFPPDVEAAFTALKRAVASGEIPESRLDRSVRAVLTAKAGLGLDKNRFSDLNRLDRVLGRAEHQQVAREIIEGAVTLLKNEKNTLPLDLKPDRKLLHITVVDHTEGWRDGLPGRAFLEGLSKRHPSVTTVFLSDKTGPGEFELVKKLAGMADAVIVCGFVRIAAYKGTIDLSEGQIDLLKHVARLEKPVAVVQYGSPYLISFVPELPTYVLAYEYYPAVEEATLKAILGEIGFRGRLPVDIPGLYRIGDRVVK